MKPQSQPQDDALYDFLAYIEALLFAGGSYTYGEARQHVAAQIAEVRRTRRPVQEILGYGERMELHCFHDRPLDPYTRMFYESAQQLCREGEIEVDDATCVSDSDDAGEYIMAWLWVDNHNVKLPSPWHLEIYRVRPDRTMVLLGSEKRLGFYEEISESLVADYWTPELAASRDAYKITCLPLVLSTWAVFVIECNGSDEIRYDLNAENPEQVAEALSHLYDLASCHSVTLSQDSRMWVYRGGKFEPFEDLEDPATS